MSRECLLKVFDKLDRDQSGCLSLEEFRRLVLVLDKEASENFVRMLWKNCGGEELGRMEFEVLWMCLHQKSATQVQVCVSNTTASIERNHTVASAIVPVVPEGRNEENYSAGTIDGGKSAPELKSMGIRAKLRKLSRKKLKQIFNKLDRNKSGELSNDELQTLIKVLLKDVKQENIAELSAELWNACMLMSTESSKSRKSLQFEALWKCIHQDDTSAR